MTWKPSRATYVGGVNTALAGPGTRSGRGGLLTFPQISTVLSNHTSLATPLDRSTCAPL